MSQRPFRPLSDDQVHALEDEKILEYVVAAREAGQPAAAARALQILAWGYGPIVAARVGLKVPPEQVEDVAAAALVRAMGAGLKPGAFRGGSVGEFRAWLHTIVDRQIADFWKARERTPKEEPLPDEHDESPWGVGVSPDETGAVDMQAVIDDALAELSPVHRQVVELHVFEERPARQAAEAVGDGMTEDNVHQIASRFRKRLRALLEEST